jgi:hypothetical protein
MGHAMSIDLINYCHKVVKDYGYNVDKYNVNISSFIEDIDENEGVRVWSVKQYYDAPWGRITRNTKILVDINRNRRKDISLEQLRRRLKEEIYHLLHHLRPMDIDFTVNSKSDFGGDSRVIDL